MSLRRATQRLLALGLTAAFAACGRQTIDLGESRASRLDDAGPDGGACGAVDCEAQGGVCDAETGACVECVASDQCQSRGVTRTCDPRLHACVMCVTPADCDALYENVKQLLPFSSALPAVDAWVCDPDLLRCRAGCEASCPFGCDDGPSPACVECRTDTQCELLRVGLRRCDEGRCVGCIDDSDCDEGQRCVSPTQTCVECLSTEECANGERCNLGTHACEPG